MVKFKFFIDFAREENWLNEMARKGYALEKVTLGYHFRKSEPEDAQIRIDHRIFHSQEEYINYCTLFEDSGWKHVAGGKSTGVQYFKRLSPASDEDIFSDDLSKAERYIRASRVWFSSMILMFVMLVVLVLTGGVDYRAMINPSMFYLTPGLWERSGDAFWRAFWFETPFALFRAALLYFYPISLLFYTVLAIKTQNLYKKEKGILPE